MPLLACGIGIYHQANKSVLPTFALSKVGNACEIASLYGQISEAMLRLIRF